VTPAAPARATVLGCAIDRLDMDQTVARCLAIIDEGRYGQHMAINAAKLVAMQDDPALRDSIAGSDIVNADGQSVVWASRLLGDPLPCRVAGIDLMHELLDAAARRADRVFILGARAEVLERAVANLVTRHPGVTIAGTQDGYFADADVEEVCAAIRAARADMLFVAMSSPRKELFLAEHGPSLGVPFVMGVGGAIDVAAGITRRAPAGFQRLGLEWLYRLLQEPRRMWRRYLPSNARFIRLVAREMLTRRRRPRGGAAASSSR
jgi:N-acetylglucosaminyldiphosphoundecaprenol N-acetyl-beta-D-mannosaminyltransferase